MRIFDAPNIPTQSKSQPERAGKIKKSARKKNQTAARVPMTPEQIRAKLQKHRMGNETNIEKKLADTKEVSTYMSEESASRVELNSINKNSQKFPNKIKKSEPTQATPIQEEAAKDNNKADSFEDIKKGTLLNDPNSSGTVNKLKDAMNSGVFRVDPKTRKVLSEIIASRS